MSGEHGFQNNWPQTLERQVAGRSGVAGLRGWGLGAGGWVEGCGGEEDRVNRGPLNKPWVP